MHERWVLPGRLAAAGLVAGVMAAPVAATNGYFPHGYGTIHRALAGTGTAWTFDAMAPAINPAGLVYVGDRSDASLEAFSPRRRYRVEGSPSFDPGASVLPGVLFPLAPGTVESGREVFAIPGFGTARQISSRSAWGVTVYGNGGMNTNYPAFASPTCPPGAPGGTFCAGGAGVDLAQLFLSFSYARRKDGGWSWGVAPIFAFQRFEATGLGAFGGFSSAPGELSDRGHDESTGFGARIGIQKIVSDGFRWGLSYRSRIYMGRFDRYRGLFAENGDFDIPPVVNAGLGFALGEARLLLDVEHVWYSQIDAVGLPLLPRLGRVPLGAAGAPGFGWDDVTTVKLGYQGARRGAWQWRVGVSRATQPIPESEVLFNVLAPGVQEWHVTAGLTRTLERGALSAALMVSPNKTVSGPNPLNQTQQIALSMNQLAFELSWAWGGR